MPIVLSNVNQQSATLKWLEELKASKVVKHISAATAVSGQFIHLVNTKDQIQHSRVLSFCKAIENNLYLGLVLERLRAYVWERIRWIQLQTR